MLAGYSITYVIVHTCKDSPTSYSLILLIKLPHEYVPRATLHMPLFHSPIQSVTLKVIGLHINRCFCNNLFQRAANKSVFQRCGSFPSIALCQPREKLGLSSEERDLTWQCHCPPWGTATRPVTPDPVKFSAGWHSGPQQVANEAKVTHQNHGGGGGSVHLAQIQG